MEDSRVTLRPLREEDSGILLEWINDRELVLLNARVLANEFDR
jgi:hypothetical protein